jgi:hypothetical protein
MTGTWLPLAATALAAALTYVCCIRPMRNHNGCTAVPERTQESVDEEIGRAREELLLLREQAPVKEAPVAAPQQGPETTRP